MRVFAMVRASMNWHDQGGQTGDWRDPMEAAQKFASRFGAAKLCAPCLCAAQDGCRMGLLLLDQAGAPNQLPSQLQPQLNTDLLSIKDSPEQGLVVCFGLACAGSLFGCRLGVRLSVVDGLDGGHDARHGRAGGLGWG